MDWDPLFLSLEAASAEDIVKAVGKRQMKYGSNTLAMTLAAFRNLVSADGQAVAIAVTVRERIGAITDQAAFEAFEEHRRDAGERRLRRGGPPAR